MTLRADTMLAIGAANQDGEDPAVPEAPPSGSRHHRLGGVLARIGPPLVVSVAVVLTWYGASYIILDPQRRFLMPPPHEVVRTGMLEWDNLRPALLALWSSTQVALVGLTIAILVGMSIAILMSQARWLESSLYPYAVFLQTIPILALVPLVGFWWGFDFPSRVFVSTLIALFPIITNTLFGLKSADQGHRDLFALHGAGRLTTLRKLLLPTALPAIFTGFRISAGLSVVGAIVGDFFFRQGEPGIGRLIALYSSRLRSEELFTAIFFSSLLGLAVFWAFGFLSYCVLKSWHESANRNR